MTVVSSEFWTLALAESQARGVRDLPLVKVPHPVGTISLDTLRTAGGGEGSVAANLSIPGGPAEMFSFFYDRGWTDGLPVLPPTFAAVQTMVAAHGKKADAVLGVIPPLNGVATVEKIAANAVMAGCLPDYFPLVLAAVRGMTRPGYNLDGLQTTTGNIAPLAIVNGPCRMGWRSTTVPTCSGRGGEPMPPSAGRFVS